MVRPGFTVLAVLVALGGCARDNPLFGSTVGGSAGADGTGAGGDDDDDDDVTTSGSDDRDDGDSTAAGMSESATGSSDGTSPIDCGNGQVEGDEECDDDREFCIDCKELGRIEWVLTHGGVGEYYDRFRAVALAGDRVVAVGHVTTEGSVAPMDFGVLALAEPDLGEWLADPAELTTVDAGSLDASRFYDVVVDGDTLYVAGGVNYAGDAAGSTAAIVVYDISNDPNATDVYGAFAGNYASSIAFDGTQLHVGLSNWTQGAWGAGVIEANGTAPSYWLSVPAPDHESNAITLLDGSVVLGGMVAGLPFLGTPSGNEEPDALSLAAFDFDGRVQGLLPLGSDLVVTGFAGDAGPKEPWIGRFTGDGSEVWSSVLSGGGMAEEFEDATLDGAGNIVAVGHIGDPSRGMVVRFEPDGTYLGMRVYDDLGDNTRFSDVVYSASHAALFIVGGIPANPIHNDAAVVRVAWNP